VERVHIPGDNFGYERKADAWGFVVDTPGRQYEFCAPDEFWREYWVTGLCMRTGVEVPVAGPHAAAGDGEDSRVSRAIHSISRFFSREDIASTTPAAPAVIGVPQGVQHTSHVQVNADGSITTTNAIPKEVVAFFASSGISAQEVQEDPHTVMAVLKFQQRQMRGSDRDRYMMSPVSDDELSPRLGGEHVDHSSGAAGTGAGAAPTYVHIPEECDEFVPVVETNEPPAVAAASTHAQSGFFLPGLNEAIRKRSHSLSEHDAVRCCGVGVPCWSVEECVTRGRGGGLLLLFLSPLCRFISVTLTYSRSCFVVTRSHPHALTRALLP
jgi:P21-Rho-binding domain